ncbi:sensor histidine kinase [Roseateles sp.]|uniref:sensor histidine kinase n=1 Tax=Roseateles sp. TaxID=1971397 RepID=UPI002F410E33
MPAPGLRLLLAIVRAGVLLLLPLLGLITATGAQASAPTSTPDRITLDEFLKNPPLDQLHHTSWGPREGLFGPVYGLAQTTDGYLWLGTDRGLLRFDGVRFETFESLAGESLPGKGILTLYATPDNGLWVGFLRGGFAFVRNGRVLLGEKPRVGGFEGATRGFVQEKDGTLWVATTRGLFRRDGHRWLRMEDADGYPGPPSTVVTMGVHLDGDGNLWADTSRGPQVKPAGQTRFVAVDLPGKIVGYMAKDPEGRIWADVELESQPGHVRMRYLRLPRPNVPGDPVGTGHPIHPSTYMPIFDRNGDLWSGALDGVTRERLPGRQPASDQDISSAATGAPPTPLVPFTPASGPLAPGAIQAFNFGVPALQRLTPNQRLTGDEVLRILEDREGSIWIGTNGGLDRLRPTRVSLFQFPAGMSTLAMAAGPRGDLWFTSRNAIFHLKPSGGANDLERFPVPSPSMSRVFVDHAGTVWLGDRRGLSRMGPQGTVIDERGNHFPDWNGTIKDIAEDASGSLWAASQFMGLLRRLKDGRWERLSGSKGFPEGSSASTIALDAQGRIWLGYVDGQLIRVDEGDRLTRFTDKEGLRIGGVLSIAPGKGHLWIGGDRGVQRLDDDGRFHDLRADAENALAGVSGIVETPEGDLWFNGAAGITRVAAADVRRAMAERAFRVPVTQLDTFDGLPGRAETSWPLRTALQTPDGRLWFAMTNGVVTVDPARLTRSAAPAVLDIQRVLVNGTPLRPDVGGLVRAVAGTRDLQVDYTSLSLAMPERASFKYRLRGLETNWHEAGSRRQAFYTNLGPGNYTFEVQGTNEDGVWSAKPAALAIEIPPTFLQSTGFRVLCALAVLIAIALVVRMRLRQIEARARERYRARLDERTRIAQDLHDTLLQGFQGLLLRFQRVAWGIPDELPARAEMERVLDQADAVVIEGRNRVTDLRLPPPDAGTLEQTLEALGRDLSGFHDAAFRIHVEGTPRALDACVHAELALVGREGLFNAFQHAKATTIALTIAYTDAAFTIRIADDGVGVPPQTQVDGHSPGHWGLSGMRERVTGVGGSFELRSAPGEGTEVLLSIPAAQAYRRRDKPPRLPALQRWLRDLLGRALPTRAPG